MSLGGVINILSSCHQNTPHRKSASSWQAKTRVFDGLFRSQTERLEFISYWAKNFRTHSTRINRHGYRSFIDVLRELTTCLNFFVQMVDVREKISICFKGLARKELNKTKRISSKWRLTKKPQLSVLSLKGQPGPEGDQTNKNNEVN